MREWPKELLSERVDKRRENSEGEREGAKECVSVLRVCTQGQGWSW